MKARSPALEFRTQLRASSGSGRYKKLWPTTGADTAGLRAPLRQ